MGIIEHARRATTAKEIAQVEKAINSYQYASPKTRRKVARLLKKTRRKVARLLKEANKNIK